MATKREVRPLLSALSSRVFVQTYVPELLPRLETILKHISLSIAHRRVRAELQLTKHVD